MTLKRQRATGTATLIAALEHAWQAITTRHPDLPPAAVILGQGSARCGGGVVLGRFAAERWQVAGANDAAYVHEVLVGGEGLACGAYDILGTLIHEAAHAIATIRGVADTSRQGRYHNMKYKTIAEELGLTVERHPVIGWSLTSLPDATAADYAGTITELDHAITLHRRSKPGPGAAGGSNLIPAACACPRRIRVAAGTLAQGAIVCAVCADEFAAVNPAAS